MQVAKLAEKTIEYKFYMRVKELYQTLNLEITQNGGLSLSKESIRKLHQMAVTEKLEQKKEWIKNVENSVLEYFADGDEINVKEFYPKLVYFDSRNRKLSNLFNYATFYWSIPVTFGFGRRLRFLVFDEYNDKLIGLIGLCDPVFNLRVRDQWIGWNVELRKTKLWHVLNAYVLGSVPPYNMLLGGKLVALLAISNKVRKTFENKYKNRVSTILGIHRNPDLVLITTTTAFGKSSMLDRLKNNRHYFWKLIGFTSGWTPIVFDGKTFDLAKKILRKHRDPEVKKYKFGQGPNWKFRVLKKALRYSGLDIKKLRVGIKRGVYVAPLASNFREYLLGNEEKPKYHENYTTYELIEFFKNRWLLNRSKVIAYKKYRKKRSILSLKKD